MTQIPIGARGESSLLVGADVAINFLGSDDARVLSTPHLIGCLEWTCRNAVKPLLGEGWDTVGTRVDVKHLAATPIGMCVTFRAEVSAVDGQRVVFRVEAYDDVEKVAEGAHERYIVEVARFAKKVSAKAAGQ
jgi:predicted thioesterase